MEIFQSVQVQCHVPHCIETHLILPSSDKDQETFFLKLTLNYKIRFLVINGTSANLKHRTPGQMLQRAVALDPVGVHKT